MAVTDEVILDELCAHVEAVCRSRIDIIEAWEVELMDALHEVTPGVRYNHYSKPSTSWATSLCEHIRIAAERGVSAGTLNWIVAQHMPPVLHKE